MADTGASPAQGVGEAFSSPQLFPPVEKDASRPQQLQENVEIADVGGEQREPEFLRLQQEHAVVQGVQLAVDNNVLLQLGINNAGTKADNYHVAPIQPDFAEGIAPHERDVEKGKALLTEAGQQDFEHEIISVDENWHKNTCDAVAAQLREAGIRIAMDDFGVGYSSMAQLSELPFDRIKLDQSFAAALRQPGARDMTVSIIRSIVQIARGSQIQVTAEGVETPEQLQDLRDLGCDAVQGFLLGRPVPAAWVGRPGAERVLRRRRR